MHVIVLVVLKTQFFPDSSDVSFAWFSFRFWGVIVPQNRFGNAKKMRLCDITIADHTGFAFYITNVSDRYQAFDRLCKSYLPTIEYLTICGTQCGMIALGGGIA